MTAQAAPQRGRAGVWVLGARPRTLVAAVVPVALGASSVGRDAISVPRTLLALLVGVAMQIGVNYANDYFDGVRGVDTSARLGPPRLVASRLADARDVAAAAAVAVTVAAVAGVALAAQTTWWLLPAGALSVAALALYSGGPRPYAGIGLGEVSVFVFFGLVATCGTAFVERQSIPAGAWWLAGVAGLMATSLLMVNNLRDIPTDSQSGKRTLAVRVGERRSRVLLAGVVAVALLLPVVGAALGQLPKLTIAAVAAAPLALPPLRLARRARGRELIAALAGLSRLYLVFGALLTALLLAA